MVKGERVIAISEFIAEHICENYKVDTAKIRLIPRGVDLNQFDPARISSPRMAELVRDWHIPSDRPVILMPGRFTRWKGQDVLIKALAALPHRNFYCVLFGDREEHPDYQQELEKLIVDSRLAGSVMLAGSTNAMPEAYMLADIVIVPSTEPEAFGRVPIEAQAMGKPVIAANHGGACETVDSDLGWLVTPGDPAAITGALEEFFALTPLKRRHRGEKAMLQVRERFSTEAMCSKTIRVYGELLALKHHSTP
jgi:glycosyltransferase involved in cell wall biosynthesis